MEEFLYMGGKAFYVWSSYGITAIGLILSIIIAAGRKKKLFREIEDNLEE